MIALLFNGNENQVRELANTLNKLHQQLETHCKVFKHEVTYTNLLISKGVQGEKKEKKRKKTESWTPERPPSKLTLSSTWQETQLALSQYVVG